MLVEKEDSLSDIDTIEEEVDLSMTEGSDHEDHHDTNQSAAAYQQIQDS